MIFLKTGVEVETQRLIYASKTLLDNENGKDKTLKDYNIYKGSTICMVMRLEGGFIE